MNIFLNCTLKACVYVAYHSKMDFYEHHILCKDYMEMTSLNFLYQLEKFDEICYKIDKVRSEIRYYYNIYNSNEGKNTLRNTGKHLKKLIRKLLPRKISANVTYGFSSPDLTGKVYGIYCLIADRFSRDSEVLPDFDREIFEGRIKARGYFNLWGILINVIAIVLNKNAIKIIKSVKRHMKKKDSGTAEETDKAA